APPALYTLSLHDALPIWKSSSPPCRAPLPTELHIPATVQGVLAARIDRLAPEEKDLLQQLAVIGREFPLSLLRHVIPQPEDELRSEEHTSELQSRSDLVC